VTPERLLVAVVNHEQQAGARRLVEAFRPHATVIALDSGSRLAPHERALFDACLPNVYYAGLLNEAVRALAAAPAREILYFVCSDVVVPDAARAVRLACDAFADPRVGVYAPSATRSGHPQMLARGGGLREAAFVEGFCFAARRDVLAALCPVDLSENRLGWGLDRQLGYLALRAGLRSVVDHRLTVVHEGSSGYDTAEAGRQRDAWVATLEAPARRFHWLASQAPLKGFVGAHLLRVLVGGRQAAPRQGGAA